MSNFINQMPQTLIVKKFASTTIQESKKSLCFLLVKIKLSPNEKETIGEKQLHVVAASSGSPSDAVALKERRDLPNFLLGTIRMEVETERSEQNGLHQIQS